MTGDPATFDTERTRQHERETIQAHGSLDSEHLLLPIAANELIILQSIAVRAVFGKPSNQNYTKRRMPARSTR